jgi:hypothetical protein
VAFGDGEGSIFLFDCDGAGRFETLGFEARLCQLSRQSHGEASGVCSSQQLFGIGSGSLLKAAVERIGSARERAARGRDRTRTALQVALPFRLRGSFHGELLPGFEAGLQIDLGRRFILERGDLIGIEADHQIANMVVDAGEKMAGARGNHHYIAGL